MENLQKENYKLFKSIWERKPEPKGFERYVFVKDNAMYNVEYQIGDVYKVVRFDSLKSTRPSLIMHLRVYEEGKEAFAVYKKQRTPYSRYYKYVRKKELDTFLHTLLSVFSEAAESGVIEVRGWI